VATNPRDPDRNLPPDGGSTRAGDADPDRFPNDDDRVLVEEALLDGDVPVRAGGARAALGHGHFRTVWLGTLGSNVGTWMQNVALGSLAYKLTKSAGFVALVGFMQLGPLLILGLVGGVLADTLDRRWVLIAANTEQLVFSLVLAFVAAARHPNKSAVVLSVLLVGIGNALGAASLSALIPTLVPRRDLAGAVSLQSAQINMSRVIGPAIGGLLLGAVGFAWVFAINAVTYLLAIVTLVVVPSPPQERQRHVRGVRRLTAGLVTARTDPFVGRILLTITTFSLLCLSFLGLMPVLAERNLHVNSQGPAYGALYACFALGASIGAVSVGTVFVSRPRGRIVRVGLATFAVSLMIFGLLRTALPAYPVALAVGATYFATVTGLSTALQEHLSDAVRGRVMALYTMGFGGTVPVGLLIFGAVADRTSVTTVVEIGAAVAVVMAAVFRLSTAPRLDAGAVAGEE
jgi:MFS family permease